MTSRKITISNNLVKGFYAVKWSYRRVYFNLTKKLQFVSQNMYTVWKFANFFPHDDILQKFRQISFLLKSYSVIQFDEKILQWALWNSDRDFAYFSTVHCVLYSEKLLSRNFTDDLIFPHITTFWISEKFVKSMPFFW